MAGICWALLMTTRWVLWLLFKNVFSCQYISRLNGVVYKRNVRIKGIERPNEHKTVVMDSPGAMKWFAVSRNHIISPCVVDNVSVTGESYRNMSTRYAIPRFWLLRQDYNVRENVATSHFANCYRNKINTNRPNDWSGRGGPVSWPPRFHILPSRDLFLSERLKSKIYFKPVDFIEELKRKVVAEAR